MWVGLEGKGVSGWLDGGNWEPFSVAQKLRWSTGASTSKVAITATRLVLT